ncbi:MAG: DinB family protein [Saprospiraceae bacterium]
MNPLSFSTEAAFAKTQTAALHELLAVQEQTIRFGESLKAKSDLALNARPAENRWSTLECLEHLNRYAAHYLPLLIAQAANAPSRKKEAYRTGLLGKPFALSLHPAKRAKTMSSPKNMNPIDSNLDRKVVDQFIVDQQQFQKVLQSLDGKSLRGSRVPVSIVPIVRLHLGDMLHTLVWHNARHTLQAEEALG